MRPRLVKLVRDGVGALLGHSTVSYEPIPDDSGPGFAGTAIGALRRKLIEEAVEYLENPSKGELADVYEVVCALAKHDLGLEFHEVQDEAERKLEERGGFEGLTGMYVTTTAPRRH